MYAELLSNPDTYGDGRTKKNSFATSVTVSPHKTLPYRQLTWCGLNWGLLWTENVTTNFHNFARFS